MNNTLILKRMKPRNPLAMAGRRRMAGVHASSRQPARQTAERALRAELKHLHPPPR